jgi:hypothetical protein
VQPPWFHHLAVWTKDCAGDLSVETFANAIQISRYFADRQLEVLARTRFEAQEKQRDRLEELFNDNGQKPITLRDLVRRHGFKREEILSSVKSRPEIFGVFKARPIKCRPSGDLYFP